MSESSDAVRASRRCASCLFNGRPARLRLARLRLARLRLARLRVVRVGVVRVPGRRPRVA
ncbi:hypothetical protein [Actinocorallia sp. A-T 12471]|uniref:hypothetical protein n=1 Tax=Actinocorallia sp. A-T 12471 TaxID=3089813 RepID=UPI0029CE74EC|nr:hypothetical protein [Actinocorallia sp. A-T 12471]MDX6741577.1 hypothetical protein [Actinocorallia sp. A-T 12471]